jgi:hypothetical protein
VPIENLSQEEIEQRERTLLQTVQAHGGNAGNVTLLNELRWPADEYWGVRDRLVTSGELLLGRGRGGSVRLNEQPTVGTAPVVGIAEVDLYDPMAAVLRTQWSRDQRLGNFLVANTARQGRRPTGGTWTRPDIVVVSLTTLPFVPAKHFDLVTFEIKPWAALDVTAVYEALAHYRAATRSYVLAHVPELEQQAEASQQLLERIYEEANRHGVGLIIASEPGNYETWDTRVDAEYHEPSPHTLNDFISSQLSDEAKEQLVTWFR